MKFRSKPIEVEAFQWLGSGNPSHPAVYCGDDQLWYVVTIHGQRAYLAPGDWVITEPDGKHHYPCKPDIFAARYQKIVSEDGEVQDEHFCPNCKRETMHDCRYSTHERDSSADRMTCQVCKWRYSGYTGKYNKE